MQRAEPRWSGCGATTVLRRGPYSIFLGCGRYPECQNTLGVGWGDRVGTDVECSGKDGVVSGKPMFATRSRYGVYLKCSDPELQGHAQHQGVASEPTLASTNEQFQKTH